MKLKDSKNLTADRVFNEMRERHKSSLIRNRFIAPLLIRKELTRDYPTVDIHSYISDLQAEIANEQNNNAF